MACEEEEEGGGDQKEGGGASEEALQICWDIINHHLKVANSFIKQKLNIPCKLRKDSQLPYKMVCECFNLNLLTKIQDKQIN